MYPLLNIFGHSVQSYYVCALLAAAAGLVLSYLRLRRLIPARQAILLPPVTALSALIGARVLNCLTNPEAYGSGFHVWTLSYRSLSLMGGLVFGAAAVSAYCVLSHRRAAAVLDAFVIPAAVGIVLLKLGCFLNGCCFGIPTDGIFGTVFPANAAAYEFINSIPLLRAKSPRVHPTQLYEAAGAFIAALAAHAAKRGLRLKDGSAFSLFAALFSAARWAVLPMRELRYSAAVKTVLYPCIYAGIIAVALVRLCLSNRRKNANSNGEAL